MKYAVLALALIVCTCIALLFQTQYAYAGWAFGDYDQDWENVDHTFDNFKPIGYHGNKIVYKSDVSTKTNTWSHSWESHEFGNYAIAVCGDSVEFFYTRNSGSNWDRDLVMKMNFSLYRVSHPSEKYTFQVIKYDGSDNDGREDSTGYLNDVRNPIGGDLVPDKYQGSTLKGIEYLYPTFFLDYSSLAEALTSGVWKIEFDSMQIYDDEISDYSDSIDGYLISFDANGGSSDSKFVPQKIVKEPYVVSECPENPFVAPEDTEFAGWALASDGEIIEFPYTLTGDTVFYAIWKKVAPDSNPAPEPRPVLDSKPDSKPSPNPESSPSNNDSGKPIPATGDAAGAATLAFGALASAAALACVLATRKREE